MTAVLTVLKIIWPYVLCVGLGWWTGRYTADLAWEAKYSALQTGDAQARADGEAAVRTDLQEQIASLKATASHNADAMVNLANENAKTIADRDVTLTRVRRLEQLLSAAAARSTPSGAVSKDAGGQSAPDAGGAGGVTPIERLLINARAEAERNADRLDTLVTEVKPQVQP